jgi:thioesterase domain-containing protein
LGYSVHGIEFVEGAEAGYLKPFASLQEMAASLASSFVLDHGDRPACFIGYSFAGLLALELARQLAESGKIDSLVAMIDTMPPAISFTPLFRIGHLAKNLGPWARRVTARFLANLKHRSNYLNAFVQKPPGRTRLEAEDWYQDLSEARRHFVKKTEAIGRQYRFEGSYRGQIVLFRQRPHAQLSADPFRPGHVEDYGRQRLTGANVQVVYIPGDHGSCLAHPHVVELATALRRVLDAAPVVCP